MQPITCHVGRRCPNWLLGLLEGHPTGRRLSRWWQWAVMSLGCLAGCSTTQEAGQMAAYPLHATGDLLARAGDRMEETFAGSLSPRSRHSASLVDAAPNVSTKELLAGKLPADPRSRSRPQRSSDSETSIARKNASNTAGRPNDSTKWVPTAKRSANETPGVETLLPPPVT